MAARFATPLCRALVAGCALLAGCALTPDYERPDLDLPGGWVDRAPSGESVANLAWWDLFRDEQLQQLIKVALEVT